MKKYLIDVTLHCDEPMCTRTQHFLLVLPVASAEPALVTQAKEKGWTIGLDSDFCPQHAPKPAPARKTARKTAAKKESK